MKLARFQDRVYARTKMLLVWEPSWETFRPVEKVVWNPVNNQVEEYYGAYIHDIFDVQYGFGSEAIHDMCVEFTDEALPHMKAADEIDTIQEFWRWCGTQLAWNGDRPMAAHPCCVDPSRKAFLDRYALRARTFKRAPRSLKATRKVSIH